MVTMDVGPRCWWGFAVSERQSMMIASRGMRRLLTRKLLIDSKSVEHLSKEVDA